MLVVSMCAPSHRRCLVSTIRLLSNTAATGQEQDGLGHQPWQQSKFAPGVWVIRTGLRLKVNWRSCCEHVNPADSAGPSEGAARPHQQPNSALFSPQLSNTHHEAPLSRTNTSHWVTLVLAAQECASVSMSVGWGHTSTHMNTHKDAMRRVAPVPRKDSAVLTFSFTRP